MGARTHDPRRLDVAAVAADGATLQGTWPLTGFTRLLQDAVPDEARATPREVIWSARGESRSDATGATQMRLHLDARTAVRLACQRCLRPIEVALQAQPVLRFVASEDEAERLDADSDEDVLALERDLDLHRWIEDELILALPLVPRHDRCPVPLPFDQDKTAPAGTEHPFAALGALRRHGGGDSQ